MNENKAIALEIIKLQGQTRSAKESAEKYNEVLEILNNGDKKEEQIEELTISKGFILRFEFGTFRVIEDAKIKVLKENVLTGGVYGVGKALSYDKASTNQSEHSVDKCVHAASRELPVANPITNNLSLESTQDER